MLTNRNILLLCTRSPLNGRQDYRTRSFLLFLRAKHNMHLSDYNSMIIIQFRKLLSLLYLRIQRKHLQRNCHSVLAFLHRKHLRPLKRIQLKYTSTLKSRNVLLRMIKSSAM